VLSSTVSSNAHCDEYALDCSPVLKSGGFARLHKATPGHPFEAKRNDTARRPARQRTCAASIDSGYTVFRLPPWAREVLYDSHLHSIAVSARLRAYGGSSGHFDDVAGRRHRQIGLQDRVEARSSFETASTPPAATRGHEIDSCVLALCRRQACRMSPISLIRMTP
jgi:hypothetical protein